MTLPFGVWDVGQSFNEAVDLEEEENEQYEEEIKTIKITVVPQTRLSSSLFIISFGTAATTFIDMYVNLPEKPTAEVQISRGTVKTRETCYMYEIDNILLCQCKIKVAPEDSFDWIKEVMACVSFDQLVILTSSPKYSLKSNLKNTSEDVLRYLKTSNSKFTTNVQILEKDNLIQGLPAAILSYCEFHCMDALMYVTYGESHFVDVFSLKAFEPVLQDSGMKYLPRFTSSEMAKKLKTFDGIGVADKNLYI